MAVIFILGSISSVAGFLAGDRTAPFIREEGRIEPPTAGPGEIVKIYWDKVTYNRRCDGVVERELKDSAGNKYPLPSSPVTYTNPPTTESFSFSIPQAITCGPASYKSSLKFVCYTAFGYANPFHKQWPIVVDTPTIPVTINCERRQSFYRRYR